MPTQINKSETFAVNFVTFVALEAALKEAEKQPESIRKQLTDAILQSLITHPNPAEA